MEIKDYIKIDNFTTKFNLLVKDYPNENLQLIYARYDPLRLKSKIESYCRSIVIDYETKEIVSFSCREPILNKEAMIYLLENNDKKKEIYKCYEGTLVSFFNHNNKWYTSTRRCLDCAESLWGEKDHMTMIKEILDDKTLEDLLNVLDKNNTYHFVIVHHENKNLVNYEIEFGSNYKKLCLAFTRNKLTLEDVLVDESIFIEFKNIFVSKQVDQEIFNQLDDSNLNEPLLMEGIIIKINNELLKLQTQKYQMYKAQGVDKNFYKSFIQLYQNDNLKNVMESNNILQNYKKISVINKDNNSISSINTNDIGNDKVEYDTVGVVDAVFKVITSELFEIFKMVNSNKNRELYKILPKEYKNIIFRIKNIYLSKQKINEKVYLQLRDVYNFIKTIPCESVCSLLRMRKLMKNLCYENVNDIHKLFNSASSKCDKVHYKLISIYTKKLFPNIDKDDIPPLS